MDISEIRRANLQILMDTRFGGAKVRIADRLGKSASYIARCLSTTIAPENRKKIGEEFARHIELVIGLERYAMDSLLAEEGLHEKAHTEPTEDERLAAAGSARRLALDASPRSRSALERIADAAESGQLSEEDMLLLEVIADRLSSGKTEKTESPHQRLRKKLAKDDPISQ